MRQFGTICGQIFVRTTCADPSRKNAEGVGLPGMRAGQPRPISRPALSRASCNAASKIDEIHRRRAPPRAEATLTGTVRQLWPYIWPGDRRRSETPGSIGGCSSWSRRNSRRSPFPYAYKWATDALGGREARRQDSLARHSYRRRRADDHLWLAAHGDGPVHAGARCAVRGGGDECGAPPRHRSFRSSASIVAALSSGAQDRRPDAHSRARPQRDRDDHPHFDAGGGSDDRRIRADPWRVSRSRSTGAMSSPSS